MLEWMGEITSAGRGHTRGDGRDDGRGTGSWKREEGQLMFVGEGHRGHRAMPRRGPYCGCAR